jgi:hypothetical protein
MTDTTVVGKCWSCARDLLSPDYGREQCCPGCGKPTRVCRNCRHYAPGRPNACVEPMAEPVLEKTKATFCEYFEPTTAPKDGPEQASQQALRDAAEALFRH